MQRTWQYKIKKETTNNKTGDAFSLTVPRWIVEKFQETKFLIQITENTITYVSGIDINQLKKNIKDFDFFMDNEQKAIVVE